MDDESLVVNPINQPQITEHPIQTVKGKHFLAVFFLSYMWGTFGVDRFYLGKVWTGLLKLITFGGLGLWTIIDLVLIMSGSMRDKKGNPMVGVAEYKKFAGMTVLISAIVVAVVVLISGISLIAALTQIVTNLQSGGTQNLIPGVTLPSMNQLQGL